MRFFKRLFIRWLRVLGYDIVRVGERRPGNPLDFRPNSSLNLIEAALGSNEGQEFIYNILVNDCRIFGGLGHVARMSSKNPFIKTVLALDKSEPSFQKNLIHYYENFRPLTINEYLGFELQNKEYGELPASCFLMPWVNEHPEEISQRLFCHEVSEGVQYGMKVRAEDGCKYFGPVSPKKISLEAKRLAETYGAIQMNGYKCFKGFKENVHGVVLYRDDAVKFVVSGGQHRVAVAAALGIKSIPVQVSPALIYRRNDLEYMPAVAKGYYTLDEAEMIFDRIFDGI